MNNTITDSTKNVSIRNGVSYQYVGAGNWRFEGKKTDGTTYIKTDKVGGRKNAGLVAVAIAGSLKRNFVGVETLDPMARGQISKVYQPRVYQGISFSHAGFLGVRKTSFVQN